MLATFFDTETTGLVKWGISPVSPEQPNLVQLGAKMVNLETREMIQSIDVIVCPDNFTIPVEASNVHHVTQEIAERVGVMLEHAVLPFCDMIACSEAAIAHNLSFDKIIMERATAIVDLMYNRDVRPPWDEEKQILHCTMKHLTPVVKKLGKKPAHNADYKWPKLIETYRHFFNKDFSGAHNAMVDVDAMIECFFRAVDLGHYDNHPQFGKLRKVAIEEVEKVEAPADEPIFKANVTDLPKICDALRREGMTPAMIVKSLAAIVSGYKKEGVL